MDPLTILGVAAAVVQFVDFGSRLLASTWKVYRNIAGEDQSLKDLNIMTRDLKRWILPIRQALKDLPSAQTRKARATDTDSLDSTLRHLCTTCDEIAVDLERVLPRTVDSIIRSEINDPLTAELSSALSTSLSTARIARPINGVRFVVALKEHWNRDKIIGMERRLNQVRRDVMGVLLTSIWFTTRNLPQNLEAFNQKQDEMMEYLRVKLGDAHTSGPAVDGYLCDLSGGHSVDDFLKGRADAECALEMADALFQQSRKPELFTHTSFKEYVNFSPEEASSAIIDWLRFDYVGDREASISDPHARTYDWALGPPLETDNGKPRWSDLPVWLASDDAHNSNKPFWVTGKPGSGKSTMLKYLVKSEETTKHLTAWAGRRSLDILTYFAWNPGADLAKSMEGFFRTIFSQLLSRHPNLAPVICPRHGQYAFYTRGFTTVATPPLPLWVLQESLDILLSLEARQFDFRLAIFVDGLDEFQVAPQTYCQLIERLASDPRIKVCAASREWKEFSDAFKLSPTIKMHELTQGTIKALVEGRFQDPLGAPRLERLQKLDKDGPDRIRKLVDDIILNADGVILWVALVTNVMVRQLVEQEPVDVLEATLGSMPPEMEGLYEAILRSVPAWLQSSAAWTLLLYQKALTSEDCIVPVFFLADECRGSPSVYNASLSLDPFVVYAEVEDRLAVRTRGILGCVSRLETSSADLVFPVHRTALDWLSQPRVIDQLMSSAAATNPHMSFFWAHANGLERLMRDNLLFYDPGRHLLDAHLSSAVAHASWAEGVETESYLLLQTLDHVYTTSTRRSRFVLESGSEMLMTACLRYAFLSYIHYRFNSSAKRWNIHHVHRIPPTSWRYSPQGIKNQDENLRRHLALFKYLLQQGLSKAYCSMYCDTGGLLHTQLQPFQLMADQHWRSKWRVVKDRLQVIRSFIDPFAGTNRPY